MFRIALLLHLIVTSVASPELCCCGDVHLSETTATGKVNSWCCADTTRDCCRMENRLPGVPDAPHCPCQVCCALDAWCVVDAQVLRRTERDPGTSDITLRLSNELSDPSRRHYSWRAGLTDCSHLDPQSRLRMYSLLRC